MRCIKEGLLSKVKSIISSLYCVVLWLARLPSHHHFQLGLDALSSSTARNLNGVAHIIQFFTIVPPTSSPSLSSSPSSPSSSLSSSWLSGDFLGTENGVYMSSNEEIGPTPCITPESYRLSLGSLAKAWWVAKPLPEAVVKTVKSSSTSFSRRENPRIGRRSCEYPPPMPSLARTMNLTSRTPWVLTRHYVNGRLILRKERVENYEYFEAERDNGRFILNLIPLDDSLKYSYMDDNLEQEKLQFIAEEEEERGGRK